MVRGQGFRRLSWPNSSMIMTFTVGTTKNEICRIAKIEARYPLNTSHYTNLLGGVVPIEFEIKEFT